MANFKFRQTTIADESDHIFELTSDPAMSSYKTANSERFVVALAALTENDNADTSPHVESITLDTLADGRIQRVKVWTGFETQAEVVTFVDYIFKDGPNREEIAAWSITHDTRTKYEVLDDNNGVLQILHDNTVLDQYTRNGFVERPTDPYFIEA